MIITGNSNGDINFYDCDLKILYWCKNLGLQSIVSISLDCHSSSDNFGSSNNCNDKNFCVENLR